MTRPEILAEAGAKLKRVRLRLTFSLRDVEERSLQLARQRQNPDYSFSKAWITDVERGRFMPGTFKLAALAWIYGMGIADIQKLYGMDPSDIASDRPLFRLPKTHLLFLPEEVRGVVPASTHLPLGMRIEKTNLLSALVDIWGDVPVPLLRGLDLRKSLYGYIGTEDQTMSPLLPPGTLVQIDATQTRVRNGPFQNVVGKSLFARPIYFLDVRSGYACGWCEVKDGVLTLIPHPESGEHTRTFRYPNDVSIVGRVTGVAMRIGEQGESSEREPSEQEDPLKK
jgi:transcriptional regulator with XRE-family HTH domain